MTIGGRLADRRERERLPNRRSRPQYWKKLHIFMIGEAPVTTD